MGVIHRISISDVKGKKKDNIDRATVTAGAGIEGDVHGNTDRPFSLLPHESFSKLAHPDLRISPGDFGENATTLGLDFSKLIIGSRLTLGNTVEVEIIQIGKECHFGCEIRETVGDCIMPREGVFAKVLHGGEISPGDSIELVEK